MSKKEEGSKTGAKTDALGRKVWDKEYYAKRAVARQYEDGQDFDDEEFLDEGKSRKKARKEAPPPSERRALEQRKEAVELDTELGKSKIVTNHTPKQQQGGYWCDVCECLIKDSQAYLDHINGKRHNRLLGMTMRVERVDVNRIKERLSEIKQEKEKQEQMRQAADLCGIETRLTEAEKEEKRRKKEKREKKKRKKKLKGEVVNDDEEERSGTVFQDARAAVAERIRKMFQHQTEASPV